jgi:hypothetical protein
MMDDYRIVDKHVRDLFAEVIYEYPVITWSGIDVNLVSRTDSDRIDFGQAFRSYAYMLANQEVEVNQTCSSLKHIVEYWSKAIFTVDHNYVAKGAFMVGALMAGRDINHISGTNDGLLVERDPTMPREHYLHLPVGCLNLNKVVA